MLVFGTRPEAIKMCPLIREFQKYPHLFRTLVCVSGQHREMLDQVLNIFNIVPDYDLNIMRSGQDLYDVTAKVLLGLRDVLEKEKPDLVFVHGDTTTSMAAALAAFYKQIPVAHVEAGLRTYNIYSPWPEEINRQITSCISAYNFCPTSLSKDNLIKEHVDEKSIFVTGNTVIDALHWVISEMNNNCEFRDLQAGKLYDSGYDIKRLCDGKQMILITGHRRENFGAGFISICSAIKDLAIKYKNVDFVYPMHMNPNVRKAISSVFGQRQIKESNLFFIEPLEYLSFVLLMSKSHLVLTDSGGVQEEAPGLKKPVLVMRDTTERPEAVTAGTVVLVGTDYNNIVNNVSRLLDSSADYSKMSKAINPYGDGHACERIVEIIKNI